MIWPKAYPLDQVARAHDQSEYCAWTINCHIPQPFSHKPILVLCTRYHKNEEPMDQPFRISGPADNASMAPRTFRIPDTPVTRHAC